MHVIKLNGYNATTENGEKLELGTFDSYGEEELQIVEAPDWVNLSVIATFNPPNKKPVRVAVDSVTGVIKVPKEATADLYGVGTIVFVGIATGAQHDLTLRSIKREIAAGRDVAFWLDKAYTHYDNSLLTEEDIAEVETLAQEYYDALDAASNVTSENAETNEQIENDV